MLWDNLRRLFGERRRRMPVGQAETMNHIIREHIILEGYVQGVGFRYRALHAAELLQITGWVYNMDDGRVEMEVQGTREDIDRMLQMIEQGRYIQIDHYWAERIPTEEEEYGFRVKS